MTTLDSSLTTLKFASLMKRITWDEMQKGKLKAFVLIAMRNLYLGTNAKDHSYYCLKEIMMKGK